MLKEICYCPYCYRIQKEISNPYKMHICTVCKKTYDQGDLIRKEDKINNEK